MLESLPRSDHELLDRLKGAFIVDYVSAAKAISERKMFQILHEETLLKVDIYLDEAIPGAHTRLQKIAIFSDIFAPIPCITDAILSKLVWVKKGSHKSRRDVWFMAQRLEPDEKSSMGKSR